MGRKKANFSPKVKQQKSLGNKISLTKKKEINVQCEKLFFLSSNSAYLNQLWENYLNISEILEKIKRLEEMKIESIPQTQAIENFLNWSKQNGAVFEGLSIKEFPGYGLGLYADADFKENELILKVPNNLIFSTETAAPELKEIQMDPLIQHMPQVALAMALLIEKYKDNSKWKPYLDILPTRYNTVLYLTTNDMIELKGSLTLERALKQCRNIARQYSYINRMFQTVQNSVSDLLKDVFTYEDYRWAVSTVMTRQNFIPNQNEMIYSLIPLWDMCNHEEGKITTDYNKTTNTCECYAMRDFNKGEQIFIYYGPRTNSDFFVHSGFVYFNNKTDTFKLRLGVSKGDPLHKERIELLDKLSVPSVGEFILKNGDEPFSDLLIGFLRILNMKKNHLDHWLNVNDYNPLFKTTLNLNDDIDLYLKKYIENRLKLLLNNYPTSEEEDYELLKTSLPTTRKLVIQMRLSEKKILNNALKYLENNAQTN